MKNLQQTPCLRLQNTFLIFQNQGKLKYFSYKKNSLIVFNISLSDQTIIDNPIIIVGNAEKNPIERSEEVKPYFGMIIRVHTEKVRIAKPFFYGSELVKSTGLFGIIASKDQIDKGWNALVIVDPPAGNCSFEISANEVTEDEARITNVVYRFSSEKPPLAQN